MEKILVFAGTIEGRKIAEFLNDNGISACVCVATEYGESLLPKGEHLHISHERLTEEEMEALIDREGFTLVVDATHPYAAVVTENIKAACSAKKVTYLRLLRESENWKSEDVVCVDSVQEAAAYLSGTTGNILATTGSKELKSYTVIPEYEERVYARVLSLPEVVKSCAELGFTGKHLICMQGPFSLEMNTAMLRQYDIRYMVTKETGKNGGFPEKVEAAKRAGATLVVIGRPIKEEGLSFTACKKVLAEKLDIYLHQQISLVGIGPGSREGQTVEARQCFEEANLIIGAKRMTESVAKPGQPVFAAYKPEVIRDYIAEHPEYEKIAVALSGDVGFYSGARKLIEVLGEDVRIVPGISSMVAFLARLKLPWEDVVPFSMHGKPANLIGHIRKNPKVYAILGTADGVSKLCEKLVFYGMGDVRVFVGENLSYPNERILKGKAEDFTELVTDPLCVVYIENDRAFEHIVTHGMSDELFLRDKVPMTKEEVRTASVSKLHLQKNSVIYDVGAGTGSVSIEMALAATDGHVYAIEKKDTAVELLYRNKQHFGADNLTIVEGLAPGAMEDLPVPTHAFIGGSSGNLDEIVVLLLQKNPHVRIVINAITLETVQEALDVMKKYPVKDTEIVSMSVARSKSVGNYHMMMGQNPVYIFSFEGAE